MGADTVQSSELGGHEAALLDALLKVSGLLVVMLDEQGRIQRFNRACEELTGFSEDELRGRLIWSTLIPEEQLPDVRQVHERLRRCEEVHNAYTNHWLTRDGERRLIQWRNAALRADDGELLGFVGTGIEVTEQERALKARWHWEYERHYLLDALPALIAHVDPDFRVRFANGGYREWFGLDPEDVVGALLPEVIGEPAFARLEPHFRQAIAGRRAVHHGNVDYLHGPARFIHGTYIPAFDEEANSDGFYIVTVDLTEPHRLREELDHERERAKREAQSHLLELSHATRVAAMSEVAGGLAHEISQPLTAIAATVEACLMRLDSDPAADDILRRSLEKISGQGQRARQIIEQLRCFLRKEHEDARVECAPAVLVEDVLLLLESELDSAGIAVETDIDSRVPALRVNRVQIEQVLFNLIRNAIDALENHEGERRIGIRCHALAGQERCRMEVSDSGPGVAESAIPKLFHPFYTTKREGLGQGLSICRSIVERHGGTLQVDRGPSGGARFGFTLPLGGLVDD